MTGMFTGIIGSLIGAGIQAAVGGIPIREDASKALSVLRLGGVPVPPANWFSLESSNQQKTEQAFGRIEQHFTGAMQVLGPCMQIAKTLEHVVSRPSQPTLEKARAPEDVLAAGYKAPWTNNKGECDRKCSTSRKVASSPNSVYTRTTKNCRGTSSPHENRNAKRAKKVGNHTASKYSNEVQEKQRVMKTEAGSLVDDKISSTENGGKGETDPRERDLKANKFMNYAGNTKDSKSRSTTVAKQPPICKGKNVTSTPKNKCGKSVNIEKCEICQTQIKMPCGHIFCSKCLNNQNLFKCPECGSRFN